MKPIAFFRRWPPAGPHDDDVCPIGKYPPRAFQRASNIYKSYSLGHQAYPNPDRDYLGETRYPATPIR